MTWARNLRIQVLTSCLPLAAGTTVEEVRKEIVAAYQQSLDALKIENVTKRKPEQKLQQAPPNRTSDSTTGCSIKT